MRLIYIFLLIISGCVAPLAIVNAQSTTSAKDFTLGSPFSEPDGRSDIVKISDTEFITLAKVKGSQGGKSDFMLEKYDISLNMIWQVPLSVESFEDYKDIYYNGKALVLLSVIHNQAEKATKLEAYAFDTKDGKKIWTKELESYQVGDWETHPNKAMVKESFVDLVCEHTNQDFITPFEYKHNINFSPDQSKFVSYVYNYGEGNLTATASVYDNSATLLNRGKISIDNGYINHGIYVNNEGIVYILNANKIGKVNIIQYNLTTKDFQILELPSSNYAKDDFHVQFFSNDVLFVGNSEVKDGKIFGMMYSKFNFKTKQVELSIFEEFDQAFKSKFLSERINNKQMKGEEDWLDYDITHFIVDKNQEVLMVVEKRSLHADGYPHIGRDAFDKSHKVQFLGHVQAETIFIFSFDKNADLKWSNFILKNQIYPANDGLNTLSFVLDNQSSEIRVLYASSEGMDASLRTINLTSIDRETGNVVNKFLPNDNKLSIARDYSLFTNDNSLVIVGKKGLLGKASMMVKYKL